MNKASKGGMKKPVSKQVKQSEAEELSVNSIVDELAAVDISDEVLEQDDKKKAVAKKRAKKEAKKHRTSEEKRSSTRKKILIIAAIIVLGVAALFVLPVTRWPILNFIGFRGDLTILAVDQKGEKAVSGATVELEDGQTVTTDAKGRALFRQERLGQQQIVLKKSGYGEVRQTVVNQIGSTEQAVSMKVVGIKLDFDIRHWLTGNKLSGVNVTHKESSAITDGDGLTSLIVPPTDEKEIEVEIKAEGFISRKITTKLDVVSREVTLVAAQKNYFISKRDGKFDIFSSDLDGSRQKKMIDATGKELEELLQFTIHRHNQQAILVANREGRIVNGRIIAGIYAIDLEKATLQKIDEGSEVQIIDWSGDVLVYRKSQVGLNYDDPNLSKLMTYHIGTKKLTEVAQTNYFSVSLVAADKVFFMPSDPYRAVEGAVLTSQHLQTGGRATYLEGSLIQYGAKASYSTLDLQDTTGASFELNAVTGAVRPIDRRPGSSVQFALSPNGDHVAWTERRDGQGVLLLQPSGGGEQRVVAKSPGLTAPLRFISDDLVVVRSATSEETADYVVSISTGKFAKIVDASHVGMLRVIGL